MTRKPEGMFVEVWFNDLTAELPPEAPRALTDLNENPNITIVQPITEPRGTRDEGALPWQLWIHLGEAAKLVRGEVLQLPLLGDPNVSLGQKLGVSGSILLRRGGTVRVFDKLFVIESGGVIFDTPDPKDPRLAIQASWRVPSGDVLFVYVTGTLSKPVFNFDRSRADALALLGSGDVSSLGINALESLLQGTPLDRVQVRKSSDDDEASGDTYTAAVRVNDRVIVEGNYQASTAENSSEIGQLGAAVDYRFGKNWSVRGQLGTIGTGVDLVYQYRY
jgi:autotransporter translocation and assembly factor TamB